MPIKRPTAGTCAICKEPIWDEHGEIPGTLEVGTRWLHVDQDKYRERAENGDAHNAVLGEATKHTTIKTDEDYEKEAEARKK